MAFIQAHSVVFSVLGAALIDVILDVFHPNPAVTNVLNLILPFLRKKV